MVLKYKMHLPHRRDTEPRRLKERNFASEDDLLAGLEKSLTKHGRTVLSPSAGFATRVLQLTSGVIMWQIVFFCFLFCIRSEVLESVSCSISSCFGALETLSPFLLI